MPDKHTDNRGIGRTTRMLEEAKRLSDAGGAVYIIVGCRNHADTLRQQLIRMFGEDTDSIKFETPGTIGSSFNWNTMVLRGACSNSVVLVDHYVIESRWGPMLDMLHRFDKE